MSEVQLYQGDCLEFMKSMPDKSVDAVITDPPYGIGYAANPIMGKNKHGICNHEPKEWDNKTVVDLQSILDYGKIQIVFGGNHYHLHTSRGWIIWHKPDSPPSMADAEMIWTNQDRNTKVYSCSISSMNAERIGHQTQKPLRLLKWILTNYTSEGDTIFDPFMGSGTTGVACVQTGRNFIGCEIDPGYFKIAEKRIHDAQQQMRLPI